MKKIILYPLIPFLLFGYAHTPNGQRSKQLGKKNSTISVRNAHSMAYHSSEAKVYLFGGANEKEVLSDLWVLEKTIWKKVSARDGPGPRTFSSMAYEQNTNRMILFGGSKVLFGKGPEPENLFNDTWQFSNGHWEKISTKNTPSPRAEAIMVYDESRERILLFGGYTINNNEYVKLGDTWEFYNNDWYLVSTTGPSARHGVSMAYDKENKSVVLFGGSTVDKQYGKSKGETWLWQGKRWKKLEINQPPGIFNASMVYDGENKELIRFGGWNGESRINETWLFANNTWKPLNPDAYPSPRNHSNMVFDDEMKRAILFGGHDGENVFGDTWEYANRQWKKLSEPYPIKRIKNGH